MEIARLADYGDAGWMMAELESFAFGDTPALQDELLELALIGRKTATSWAASEGDKGAAGGKLWIVKAGRGRPGAILETVDSSGGGSERSTRPSLTTRAREIARSPIGDGRTRPISPGGANSRRTWSFIASGSG